MSHNTKRDHAGDGANPKKKVKRGGFAPTVQEIINDYLTTLSLEYWAPLGSDVDASAVKRKAFNPQVIEDVYSKEILVSNIQRVMLLELSHYLENYLWPNFNASTSSFAHVMSIIAMVNEKFRENVQAWDCFHEREDVFPAFFQRVLTLREEKELTINEKIFYTVFMVNCFQSFEDAMVRNQCKKLVTTPLWLNLCEGRLKQELKGLPKLQRHFEKLKKDQAKETKPSIEKTFFPTLLQDFFAVLKSIHNGKHVDPRSVLYIERFTELMIDLVAQLPTRRFFHAFLSDSHFTVKCRQSVLATLPQGRLFNQLLDILRFYEGFEINDLTGNSLTDTEMSATHADRIQSLQRIAFKHFEELKELALSNIASVDTRPNLLKHLNQLEDADLRRLCVLLNLLPEKNASGEVETRAFLLEIIITSHERRISQLDAINEMPLYPNEKLLWDENVVPTEHYTGETCLALPKLNLQFLTFHDYLLRNFNLFRLESTYEIREDVEDAVKRNNIRKAYDGSTVFDGWSRMALPIKEFRVTNVAKPNIGEQKPATVVAEVTYTLSNTRQGPIRNEWENLKQHDILFLVTVVPTMKQGEQPDPNLPFSEAYGVKYVRGAEVMEVLDEAENTVKDTEVEADRRRAGQKRTVRIWLDSSQYQLDSANGVANKVYDSFNLVMRRKPKENNFKAVLETIRDLMNTRCLVPEWLHDVFLGYGDPSASTASSNNDSSSLRTYNFNDTFLNLAHLRASFPTAPSFEYQFEDYKGVKKLTSDDDVERLMKPPFKVAFPRTKSGDAPVIVTSYVKPNPGPYPFNKPKQNAVPFTPVQVEAVRSGMNEGLTMVVGPPGTGKTDVAVQTISNIYHNYPDQRTLIVTHSNTALNQLFEKIAELDINERHLLRLGHGEGLLEVTGKSFSKFGRVNFMLAKRLEQLAEVERLATSLGVTAADVAYTCETAGHFFLFHVMARWEEYKAKLKALPVPQANDAVSSLFPFTNYFENAPQPLFKNESYEEDLEIAEGCFRHLKTMFTEIEECRAFELLRNGGDRANYLLMKQARIIAMTCTHAALKRSDLVSIGFKYDNLLMEESAQILEIETFIPMLLQNSDEKEGSRLKRVILIGDHNQLPPIVKNMAFQKYSHLDQSLFARFVRLCVPTLDLDMQGRARPSIAELYNWRYRRLGNLPNTQKNEFLTANAGFVHDYQLIDVQDYEGKGESEPNPYFYQNLGEAEYVVAVYMYMRLLGYPASKISIITTYNGQKHLIRDIVAKRCVGPNFGPPAKITTVDRFQGQQNDFMLLSLVRTKTVGHLRDVRRLVVAMSRARLGLYVFCRKSLFENCYELTPTFSKLLQRPHKLQLVQNESNPTTRKAGAPVTAFQVEDVIHMGSLVTTSNK